MDQRPNVSINNSAKPSKLLALIALAVAFALPFILVKSFPNKQKANYDSKQRFASPKFEKREKIEAETVKTEKQETPVSTQVPSIPSALPPTKKDENIKPKPDEVKQVTPTPSRIQAVEEPKEELKTIITRKRDSLASVFNRVGLDAQTLQTILRENPRAKAFTKLKPQQKLQFLIKGKTLIRMTLPLSITQYMVVYRDRAHYKSAVQSYKTTTHNQLVTVTIRGTLYNSAKRNNVPYKLIQQMTEIFAWDINFAKDVRADDQFSILYKAFFVEDKMVGTGDILAVSYRNRGKTYQAVLHTNRQGSSNYYSPDGKSLKNAFSRYPLHFSHISSAFSLSRYHPILHYRRAHKGVDLTAPIGTPIVATGDGRIEIIGRQSGYGNMIKIKHNKIYSTIYGHMLRFQKGLSKGSYVKRGQVIGFVGQTGLASGPHCHYEFHINRQPKNPTTVNLPKGDPVPAREMAKFKANTATLLAQLQQNDKTRYANTMKKTSKVG